MNDRFKFRVWEKDQKIMKECTQITVDKDQSGSMCDVKGKVTAHLVYQPHYILMQSTGLKDKNETLIYEGDVVKFNFDTDEIKAVVSWDSEELIGFYLNTTDYFRDKYLTDYDFYKNDYEVIGNIYENKELLE